MKEIERDRERCEKEEKSFSSFTNIEKNIIYESDWQKNMKSVSQFIHYPQGCDVI